MYNTNSLIPFTTTNSLLNELDFLFPTYRAKGFTDYLHLNSKIAYKQKDDVLEIEVLVAGHDPKSIKVDLTESTIQIKSEKREESNGTFATPIDETLRLHREFNGLSAKAKIENGVLRITIDKKEESKPKKLSITF